MFVFSYLEGIILVGLCLCLKADRMSFQCGKFRNIQLKIKKKASVVRLYLLS